MTLKERITILQGDITTLAVDAIVNAANPTLLGGGGVDGAIHRAAGPQLVAECRQLGGCRTGEAKITNGYQLPARYVIHTVGPIWRGGTQGEPQLLRDCYHNSLQVAARHKLDTVAFPAISTGAYGFPPDRATEIALNTTLDFLHENALPSHVTFVCFSQEMSERYERILEQVI